MEKNMKFITTFTNLGLDWHLDDQTFKILEEYVGVLFGNKDCNEVNTTRTKMFTQKYSSARKVIDLALPPPCRSVLNLHTNRTNLVAKMWKSSNISWFDMPNIEEHGWNVYGEID